MWRRALGEVEGRLGLWPSLQFPPGIVKMKDDNFVMGDALTKYVNHAKTIYAHEMMVILDEKEKMSEKVRGFFMVWG